MPNASRRVCRPIALPSTDRHERQLRRGSWLVGQAQRSRRDAQSDPLAGTFQAHQLVFLVERDGEMLQRAGPEVRQRECGIDFDPGPVEGDVAQADIGGEPGACTPSEWTGLAFGKCDGLSRQAERRMRRSGMLSPPAPPESIWPSTSWWPILSRAMRRPGGASGAVGASSHGAHRGPRTPGCSQSNHRLPSAQGHWPRTSSAQVSAVATRSSTTVATSAFVPEASRTTSPPGTRTSIAFSSRSKPADQPTWFTHEQVRRLPADLGAPELDPRVAVGFGLGGEPDDDLPGPPVRHEVGEHVRVPHQLERHPLALGVLLELLAAAPRLAGSRRRRRSSRRRRLRRRRRARPRRARARSRRARRSRPGRRSASPRRSRRPGSRMRPRRTASAAIAMPWRPLERLPTNRTGSKGSRVPPALTTTRTPARSPCSPRAPVPAPVPSVEPVRPAGPRGVWSSTASAAATMSSGSAIRPMPASSPVSAPTTGPTRWHAAVTQRGDVRTGRGVLPHLRVHRGGDHHGCLGREQRRAEQVAGQARAPSGPASPRWRGR